MKLNFGFENYPYAARYSAESPLTATTRKRAPKHITRSQNAYGQGKTTVEVAEDLEERYGIVRTFYEMEEDSITELIENAFNDQIEEVMSGVEVPTERVTSKETEKIEAKFRRALSSRRFDGVIAGVPTATAQRGVSHLYQKPYARRAPRPSFIDTGMYQRSFRCWVEED